jgi:hypothetical protein
MIARSYLGEKTMGAPTSRRKFLAGSAALAGGALMAVPGAALADNDEGKKHRVTDVEILN